MQMVRFEQGTKKRMNLKLGDSEVVIEIYNDDYYIWGLGFGIWKVKNRIWWRQV